jgi:molybdenum cofactor cytidylyltransferase
MFLLGDQPLVDAALINLLLQRYAGSEKPICVPTHRGIRGNPTLFGNPLYPEMLNIAGDKGARDIIAAHPDQVLAVEIPDPLVFLDIDRREDVEKIAALLESRQPSKKIPL